MNYYVTLILYNCNLSSF